MRHRILVADEQAASRELLRAILEHGSRQQYSDEVHNSYEVIEACDAAQALGLLLALVPDLIIVDLLMVDLLMLQLFGGGSMAELLEQRGLTLPVVVLTPAISQTSPDELAAAGFAAYLVKPIVPARLRACVAGLLGSRAPRSLAC